MRLFLWFSNTVQFQKNIFIWISVQKIDYFRNPYEICVHTNDQNRWDSKGSERNAGKEEAKQPRLSLSTSTVNVCCCHWEATTSSAAASTKAPLELQLRSENSASLLPKDERRVSYQPRTSTEVALTKWWTLVDTSPATVEHCHFGIEEKKCQFWSLVCVLRSLD